MRNILQICLAEVLAVAWLAACFRLVPVCQVAEAVCLPSLSYHEAWELSYFGASVLHPRTTMPAMKYNIPISIRNFFNQAAPGDYPTCDAFLALPHKHNPTDYSVGL